MKTIKRMYPICCTSAYCGGGGDDCKTCSNGPQLREFKQWVADNNAKCLDEVWSPLFYVAEVTA